MKRVMEEHNVKGMVYGYTPENRETNSFIERCVEPLFESAMVTKVDESSSTVAAKHILTSIGN
jgi:hypothetical protein